MYGLPSMKIPMMEAAIQGIVKSYAVRGFLVKFIFVDLQFKAIKDCSNIEGAIINVVSRDEHVKDIKRFIRVLKEQARCYWAILPFKKIPERMMVRIMLTVPFYVNTFSPKSGISDHMSLMTIVEGVKLDYNKYFKVITGEYAQTFEGSDNTMKERTIGAIALGPSGNLKGGVRFSSLKSGLILNRNSKDF